MHFVEQYNDFITGAKVLFSQAPTRVNAPAARVLLGTPLGMLFGCKSSRCAVEVTVRGLGGNFERAVWPKPRPGAQKVSQRRSKSYFFGSHSLGLTWTHLESLGITWTHLDSIAFTWAHLDLFEPTWNHWDSLELTDLTEGKGKSHRAEREKGNGASDV